MNVRRHDTEAVRTAIMAQACAVEEWFGALDPPVWSRPSVLSGWTVADLAVHVTTVLRTVSEVLSRPTCGERPLTVEEYLRGVRVAAQEIQGRDLAGTRAPEELLVALRTELARAADALHGVAAHGDGPTSTVLGPRGPVRVEDFLATRVLELVAHSDDLARSVPEAPSPDVERTALRIAVRLLTGLLAATAPGHAVEVRVPPYAAVQCVEGPRHTRGTPPNVVEADPHTWVRLATGRITWEEAVGTGAVHASGERSDISCYLPVMG